MRAVVKEDVGAQQEAARRNRDDQREQVRDIEQPVYWVPGKLRVWAAQGARGIRVKGSTGRIPWGR